MKLLLEFANNHETDNAFIRMAKACDLQGARKLSMDYVTGQGSVTLACGTEHLMCLDGDTWVMGWI